MSELRFYSEFNQDDFKDFNSKEELETDQNSMYWACMGLEEFDSKSTKPINTIEKIEDDIIKSNEAFFGNISNNMSKIPIISVDGTCCTGKSTLCSEHKSIKPSKHMSSVGMNTSPAGGIGYYYASLKALSQFYENQHDSDTLLLSDRVPWNNFQWSLIWKCLVGDNNEKVHRNSYTYCRNLVPSDMVYSDYTLNCWKQILSNTSNLVLQELVNSTIPIFLVDSCEANVRERMANRNTGSDSERCGWEHYIAVQNFAYAYFAKKFRKDICIIDINRYRSHNDTMTAISNILNKYMSQLQQRVIEPLFDCNNSEVFVCSRLSPEGIEHERNRPLQMDEFCSNLKNAYKEIREDMATACQNSKRAHIEYIDEPDQSPYKKNNSNYKQYNLIL
ncbi:p-loop NTPase [Homarus gammarus nudivirus]|uniref:p-loop NTPase n=1 Tax=Homarus gammarus nudivirus TaxID=2509616 RepID=A0A411HB75_9VIRU|nr:p-loop NTPase [Homarus gammarus nudivirus]QBB28639.1 p-loop NTPase [Homarus gammarus nudivirus]